LLRALFHKMAKNAVLDPKSKRPVFIELKNSHLYTTAEEFFLAALPGDLPRHMSQTRFNFLRSSGRFSFLLDGFDEMKLPDFESRRARKLIEIMEFIGSKSSIVISCRPTYFATEIELKEALLELTEHRLRVLSRLFRRVDPKKARAKQLLDAVGTPLPIPLKNRDIDVYYLNTFDEKRIKLFIGNFVTRPDCSIEYSVDRIYQFLVSVYDISDLIKRPLLLYIIMKMIEFDVVQPDRDQDLGGAAEIYSLYIESCVSREFDKRVGREIFSNEERKQLCQNVALLMSQSRSLRVTWGEIVQHIIREAADNVALAGKIERFGLQDIAADVRVCSFLRFDDEESLRFAHKSFMEFLVAQYVFEQQSSPLNIKPLRIPLSQEILFFISEFAKINPDFAGRICVGRLLQAARRPQKLTSAEFDAVRRNMLAVNLLSNFERKALSLERLVFGSVAFADVDMKALSIYGSKIFDISMLRFRIDLVQFHDCTVERLELADWTAARFELSGKMQNVRVDRSQFGILSLSAETGDMILSQSKLDGLSVDLRGSARLQIGECDIESLTVVNTGESIDIRNCSINKIEYEEIGEMDTAVRMAQALSFRACTGDVKNLLLGRVDKELLDRLISKQGKGLFFVDPELWSKHVAKEDGKGFFLHGGMLLVRVGAASELLQEIKEDVGARSADLRACIR